MPGISVTGVLYGDEGKGKVSDAIGEKADIFVKFQGGSNSGNTVVVDGKEVILHVMPAGVVRNKRCLVASGVVLHPERITEEIELFDGKVNFGIDPRTHIILPYHIALDVARERELKKNTGEPIGTTAQGIGPCYEDSKNRLGLRFGDLVGDPALLEKKLRYNCQLKSKILNQIYDWSIKVPQGGKFGAELVEISEDDMVAQYLELGRKLKPYLTDVSKEIREALKEGKNVIFQGSQGLMLDITFGNYPKVTSSHPMPAGVFTSIGLPPMKFEAIGVVKAYMTKVGSGPVATCLDGGKWPVDESLSEEVAKRIRKEGNEYGATTGRPRRVGWPDMVILKYSCDVCGYTQLAITKLDTLGGIGPIKIAVAYECDGKEFTDYPAWDAGFLLRCKPKYVEIPGFEVEEVRNAKTFEELPEGAKQYITMIGDITGVPVTFISTGPDRNQTILRGLNAF